ncbi:hypothetical protein [Thomasclavelia cocleata]|nr:hypothetical protein [Thomasclavelia cocleata]
MKGSKVLNLSNLKKVNVVEVKSEIVAKKKSVSYSRTEPRPSTTISYVR